jgi:hypothetical protein
MVASYRLFAWYTTLEFYKMPKPVPSLYSLGVAPFSLGSFLNLLGTTGLPATRIFYHCFPLHDQPSPDQRLFFQADHEHFYFLSADLCYYDDMHLEHG